MSPNKKTIAAFKEDGGRVWHGATKQAFDEILGEKNTVRKSKRHMRVAKRIMKKRRSTLRELAKR